MTLKYYYSFNFYILKILVDNVSWYLSSKLYCIDFMNIVKKCFYWLQIVPLLSEAYLNIMWNVILFILVITRKMLFHWTISVYIVLIRKYLHYLMPLLLMLPLKTKQIIFEIMYSYPDVNSQCRWNLNIDDIKWNCISNTMYCILI